MTFDGFKGYTITIEKDGHNEGVYGTKKYKLYIGERLLESFDTFTELKDRLNKLLEGSFGK